MQSEGNKDEKTEFTDTEVIKAIGLQDRFDRRSEGNTEDWPDLVNE